jgi:hypothetical protein
MIDTQTKWRRLNQNQKRNVNLHPKNKKAPSCDGAFLLQFGHQLHGVEAGIDLAEDIADDRAEDHKSRDNNNGNQNKNQRIFDQTLTFFLR